MIYLSGPSLFASIKTIRALKTYWKTLRTFVRHSSLILRRLQESRSEWIERRKE
jgi:hypothetical protein